MQKIRLLLLTVFASVNYCFAQCPTTGFSLLDDTVCAGVPFSFSNGSNSGSYQWDFCAGDLKTIPQGVNLGNQAGLLSFPQQVKIVLDNGNYYAFVANFFGPNVIRYDFGPSLDNPAPGTFTYSGFINPIGVDVMKAGNTWYVLVTDYGNAHLIRMDLGSAIANNTSSPTDLGGFGFTGPRNVKIVNDNGNYFTFVTNDGGNNINKIEFGSSLGNAVTNSSVLTDPTFQFTYGIDVAYSCSSNKYVGFVANNAGNNISVIDFGNSLANTGGVVHTLSMPPGFGDPYSLTLGHDGDDWHLFFVSNSANKLDQLILGNDLLNTTPINGYADTIGTLNGPRGLSMIKDSSRWYGLITNTSGTTITKFKFENNCTANIPYSTDSLPQNVFYSGQGWQQISLCVTNNSGFINCSTDSIYISSAPTVSFSFGAACLGQPVSFHDSSTLGQGSISTWQWDFGDGSIDSVQNPTYVYTNDSTYLVTLTATSDAGCAASFSDSISVHDLPTANFSFVNNQCSETYVQFIDLSTTSAGDSVVAWEWNFGDSTPLDVLQNPLHAFDTSGVYSVQLIVFGSSGCSDTIFQSITIKPRPVISFTVSQTCVGETSLFSNGTIISDGSSLSYTWDFGDGSATSGAISPSYLYPLVPMTYTVQLIANSTNGCADTLLQNIRISTRANPGFISIPAAACLNNTIQFIDTSTIANGDTIALSTWDFGDASAPAYGDTVSHIYALSGTFNVTLTVTSLTACDTSVSKTIVVLESPTANFISANVCMNAPMYFYDSSSTPIGSTIDSIIWDFGDLSPFAYGDTVVHGYATAGTFNVIQTVINNFGCTGTITQQVTVYALPVANFDNNILACTGNAVNFINQSTVQNDTITGYQWDFGDGGIDSVQNPVHIFNLPNTYQVSLIVTSLHGCQATITLPVTVYQSPSFTFTDLLFCIGDSTHFNYIPLNSVPVSNWLWNFGDSGSSILPNPGHAYSAAGTYNVSLTVTALNNCSNTISQFVTINPKPVAGIISDTISCTGTTVTFDDNSTISSGVINQWFWNFGDGTAIETIQNTTHYYGNDSTYNVIHTVISDAGCSDIATTVVEIVPMPVANFTPNPNFGSPPLLVQFNNTSTGATSYQWDFGDGGTDIVFSPSHSYIDTGYYQVTLIVTNSYNCSDTAYNYVSVLIPYLDLAVKEIHATQLNDLLSLSSDLVNLGNIPVYKFQISAKIENGSPINEQWSSSSPLNPGKTLTYPFTARYKIDPLNIPSFYCIEISEINDTIDAVESNNKKCSATGDLFELFDIYPNPTNDQINISMNVPLDGTIDISIYNAAGQLMKLNAEIPVRKGYNGFNYSIRHFAKGMYAFTVKYRDDIRVKKISKR